MESVSSLVPDIFHKSVTIVLSSSEAKCTEGFIK